MKVRQLYVNLQSDLAEQNQSDVFKTVQNYKAELEQLSGFPIRIQEVILEGGISAILQPAWKYKRDYHLLKTRASYPVPLISHIQCHELTHLKFESLARKASKNLFFAITEQSRETALLSIGNDLRKLEKRYPKDALHELALNLVSATCQFLINCPLDMLIERELLEKFPVLRPSQFLSVRLMTSEAARGISDPIFRKITPRRIMQANLALNGAYALFVDDLFGQTSNFASVYQREETFALSQRILTRWRERAIRLQPGEEYQLVDEFAEMAGLSGWYDWVPDSGKP